MHVCVCVYTHTTSYLMPKESTRGHRTPWNWNYRLEIDPRVPARTSALN